MPLLEGFQKRPQEGVGKYLVVLLNRLGIHAAIAGDVCEVHQLPVAVGRGVEEPREGGQVPRQPFVEYLFLQVVPNVSLQRLGTVRVALKVVDGDQPVVERPEEVHLFDLGGNQGEHFVAPSPAAQ